MHLPILYLFRNWARRGAELQIAKLLGTSKTWTVPDVQASPRRRLKLKERSWNRCRGCQLLPAKSAWDAGIRSEMHGCSVNQAGRVLRANSCGPRGPAEPEPVPHRKKRRSSFGDAESFSPKNNRIFNRIGKMKEVGTKLTKWCRIIEWQTCLSEASSNINDFPASLFSILGALVSQQGHVRTSCD